MPILIRRLLHEHFARYEFQHFEWIGARGNQYTIKNIEDLLELARRNQECKGVIVLLDTEKDHLSCPPELAYDLSSRAEKLGLPFPVAIACAKCNYESWFLASIHSLKDKYDFPKTLAFDGDPENTCSAKHWLTDHMPPGRIYKESVDQPRMTALLDIPHLIEHSRSFRRIVHAVEEILDAIDRSTTSVTPAPHDS